MAQLTLVSPTVLLRCGFIRAWFNLIREPSDPALLSPSLPSTNIIISSLATVLTASSYWFSVFCCPRLAMLPVDDFSSLSLTHTHSLSLSYTHFLTPSLTLSFLSNTRPSRSLALKRDTSQKALYLTSSQSAHTHTHLSHTDARRIVVEQGIVMA